MSKKEKLLDKARRNPQGLKFGDFETLLKQCGWTFDHQRGSHQIWYSPGRYRLSVQNRKGMAKGYQVRQFLSQFEIENGDE